jgi:hypothetical protein
LSIMGLETRDETLEGTNILDYSRRLSFTLVRCQMQ